MGLADGEACEDGDPCTFGDACKAGVCVTGKNRCGLVTSGCAEAGGGVEQSVAWLLALALVVRRRRTALAPPTRAGL